MKSELRLQPHSVTPGTQVIEVLRDGQLIATVVGSELGVKVITKHATQVVRDGTDPRMPAVDAIDVRIYP